MIRCDWIDTTTRCASPAEFRLCVVSRRGSVAKGNYCIGHAAQISERQHVAEALVIRQAPRRKKRGAQHLNWRAEHGNRS